MKLKQSKNKKEYYFYFIGELSDGYFTADYNKIQNFHKVYYTKFTYNIIDSIIRHNGNPINFEVPYKNLEDVVNEIKRIHRKNELNKILKDEKEY